MPALYKNQQIEGTENLTVDDIRKRITGASSPVPTASATPASAYKELNLGTYDGTPDTAISSLLTQSRSAATTPVDERRIYNDKLRLYQAEIDANNKIYAQKLTEAKQQSQGNLGTGRAIQARSGTLGSDFATAQNAEISAANQSNEDAVLAEKQARIAAILGNARNEAASEIQAKRQAQQQGLQDYLTYLGAQGERRTKNTASVVSSIFNQGLTIEDIDPSQLSAIAKTYGISTQDLVNEYTKQKGVLDAQAEEKRIADEERRTKAIKDLSFNLNEGESYYQYDPESGGYTLVAAKAKTYAPSAGGGAPLPGASSALVNQPGYSRLTAKQKTQADSLNNLVRTLQEYRDFYEQNPGIFGGAGGNLFGADSGLLQTKVNSIIFAAAQAEGTGALQQADREVIEKIIPNPSSVGGAFNTAFKGGKGGNLAKIDDQITKYAANLAGYGLTPVVSGGGTSLASRVEAAGFDYAAMRADGLTDAEIAEAIGE